MIRAALLVTVAGCWRDPPPVAPEPPPPQTATVRHVRARRTPCELAIDHVLEIGRDQLDPAMNLAHVREQSVASCQDMTWSAEVLQCLTDLPAIDQLESCQNQMTPEQVSDVLRRIGESP